MFSFQFLRPEFKVFSKKNNSGLGFRIKIFHAIPFAVFRGHSGLGFRVRNFRKIGSGETPPVFFANYLITLVADSGYSDVVLLWQALLQSMFPQGTFPFPLPLGAMDCRSAGTVFFV